MEFTAYEQELLDNRIISLETKEGFDGAVQRYAGAGIRYLNLRDSFKPIGLWVDSPGGRLHAQQSFFDIIRMSSAPVEAIVTGFAGSSALNVVQVCPVRKMWPNADIMFHALGLTKRIDDPEFDQEVKSSRRQLEKLIALLSWRSGQPRDRLREWAREQRSFSAKESLEYGFIDEIVPPLRGLPPRRRK